MESIHPEIQKRIGKVQQLDLIEDTLASTTEAGIAVMVNLIYGFPGETEEEAIRQFEWLRKWEQTYPGLVFGSHNMLEVNEGSPMAHAPEGFGIKLLGMGPWAFSYAWNAPSWRSHFAKTVLDPAEAAVSLRLDCASGQENVA